MEELLPILAQALSAKGGGSSGGGQLDQANRALSGFADSIKQASGVLMSGFQQLAGVVAPFVALAKERIGSAVKVIRHLIRVP